MTVSVNEKVTFVKILLTFTKVHAIV
jgi:hypothetical protein